MSSVNIGVGDASIEVSVPTVVVEVTTSGPPGPQGPPGEGGGSGGISQDEADARYVNVDGDTMTGALTMGVDMRFGATAGFYFPDEDVYVYAGTAELAVQSGTGGGLRPVRLGEPTAGAHAATASYVQAAVDAIELLPGPEGPQGPPGADSTVPGPPGPTAVSTDAGNTAVLGSDDLIYVPAGTGGGGVAGSGATRQLAIWSGATTITGDPRLAVAGGRLRLADDPLDPLDAATKQYVDANAGGGGITQDEADQRYVNAAGGDTMSGSLTMNGGDVRIQGTSSGVYFTTPDVYVTAGPELTVRDGTDATLRPVALGEPTDPTHAATRQYVDDGIAAIELLPGPEGPEGPEGPPGADGPAGPGVAAGGASGQILSKASATDYDTTWVDPPTGGGGVTQEYVDDREGTTSAGDVTLDWNTLDMPGPHPVLLEGSAPNGPEPTGGKFYLTNYVQDVPVTPGHDHGLTQVAYPTEEYNQMWYRTRSGGWWDPWRAVSNLDQATADARYVKTDGGTMTNPLFFDVSSGGGFGFPNGDVSTKALDNRLTFQNYAWDGLAKVAGADPVGDDDFATKRYVDANAGGGGGGGDADWTPMTPLGAGWVNFGGTFAAPAFRKTSDGTVIMRGSIKSGSLNGPVFTLPEGYRLAGDAFFAICTNTNGGFIGTAKITAAGVISITAGSTAQVTFDSISFYADA